MIDIDDDRIDAEAAVEWTRDVMGTLIAVVAAFGLFWRALNGEPLELQFGYVLALLAGLLLISVNWSLAIALAAIGVALIVRGIILRTPASAGTTVDRPLT